MNETQKITTAPGHTIALEELLPWDQGREVNTSRGRRLLRKALPSLQFRALWKRDKASLQAAGIGWGQDKRTGEWEVCWWLDLDQKAKADSWSAGDQQAQEADIPLPKGVTLYPFQRRGVLELLKRKTVLLGDQPGLGKTAQVIGVCNSNSNITTTLVVCPASLKLNWKREFTKFGSRDYNCLILSGKPHAASKEALQTFLNGVTSSSPRVVIVNWDILHDWAPLFRQVGWSLIAADESHYAKNPKAKRTVALVGKWDKDPAKKIEPLTAEYRIAMTGTPLPNRPVELIPTLDWLDQIRKLGGSWKFKMDFCDGHKIWIGRGKEAWDFTGASNLSKLQDFLRSNCMVRRLKSDVLTELPAKTRQVIELPCPGELMKQEYEERGDWEDYYERIEELEEKVQAALKSEDKAALAEAVAKLAKARKVAFDQYSKVRKRTGVFMIEPALEHINDLLEEQEKLVVFAWHREVVETLAARLQEFGAVHHYGGLSQEVKQQAVDRFQSDPSCKVFVGNIQSAGVGITLTAANQVLFVEADWVPGNLEQAEDRLHRISQRDNVFVQYLVFEGSLGALMLEKVVQKMKVQEDALDSRR